MDYGEEAGNPTLWAPTRSPTVHVAYFTDLATTQALVGKQCVLCVCLVLKTKFQGDKNLSTPPPFSSIIKKKISSNYITVQTLPFSTFGLFYREAAGVVKTNVYDAD